MLAESRVRTKMVPLLVLVLGVAAIVATTVPLQRSVADRQAELKLAKVEVERYGRDADRLGAVFAAGDVRAGATKRVSGAVGDGALAVRFAHQVLQA